MSRSDRSRADKLQTLTRLLSHREAEARQALASRRAAVDGAAAQAEELGTLNREYDERLQASARAGARAADVLLWRQFNQSLCDVADVQGVQVERLEAELVRAQQACFAARARLRGAELLGENAERRQARRERRREERLAAEVAARRRRA